MALFALVPGLPFLPFILGSLVLGAAAYWGAEGANKPKPEQEETIAAPVKRRLGDILDFDDIHIEFAPDLVAMVLDPATGLDTRIGNMRNHIASAFGLILPEIRLTDEPSLPSGTYCIRLQGVEQVRDKLYYNRVLALLSDGLPVPEGMDVREPVYGAPAR
jgi:flagellar biosynthesis protein FlhA